ncbi:MAG: putative ribosomal N-acetyltransferase YdaF [Chlamydiae bacterium]|nr:putative ribosomal N-acetyltransferase YdaF [Chlamydiota bacterium]
MQEFANGQSVRLILFEKEALSKSIIGMCNFTQMFRGPFHGCYLGYKIDSDYEGQGLMYEALKCSCSYMLDTQNIHRIMACYMPANRRSGILLKRLGFQKEGVAKQYLLVNGKWEDHVLTSLINQAWKNPE